MMLSVTPGWNNEPPPFAPGERLIGFEGEVAASLQAEGARTALELAQQILGQEQLNSGRMLFDLPAQAGKNARVATHWQLPESADVEATAARLAQLPGIAYAEPDYALQMKSTPDDPGFTGDWEFGLQEHLITIGAPDAWDVTTGDANVVVADLDGDGDLDVLSGVSDVSGCKRVWYENIDGRGNFGPRHVIDTGYAVEIQAADLDADGDLDVISISVGQDDTIVWHENTDGKGNFGPYQEIVADLRSVDAIHTADLDGDSDLDVLSGVQGDDLTYKIAWSENTDGGGGFGPLQVITTTIGRLADIDAADLDGDGIWM